MIGFHLAAESFTALVLTTGGMAMRKRKTWGRTFLLVRLGMVTYSEIVSPVISRS